MLVPLSLTVGLLRIVCYSRTQLFLVIEHLDDDEDDYSSDEDTNEEDGPKRQRKRRNRASIQCKICEVINLIDIANERGT